ncbi:MAG: hypothetical protein ABEI74_02140 [Candidatus Pacearchaeota archaeon]
MKNIDRFDKEILGMCHEKGQTLDNLKDKLDLSYRDSREKTKKLQEKGLLISQNKRGFEKFISRTGPKIDNFMRIILSKIHEKGGEMTYHDYKNILELDPDSEDYEEKVSAMVGLPYVEPNLIRTRIELTEPGKNFLKKNLKRCLN